MTVTATHAPGTFCWLDLATHDNEGAKAFYTAFFGWTVEDMKYGDGPGEVYSMFLLDGRQVAASYAMDETQRAQGVPPAWLSYVCVESVDRSAARAVELDAILLAEPLDVLDSGRMALIGDPTGAMLALWEPRAHPGVGVRDEPGSLTWNELSTRDVAAARAFYTELFGWGTEEIDTGMAYTMFTQGEKMAGGMYALTPGIDMPVLWTPYFAVEDVGVAGERARELGGEVLMGPEDIPGIGQFVLVRDPQGAMFYAFTPISRDQS
jgi:predicted enzyme related to lactoylglutathione lyase